MKYMGGFEYTGDYTMVPNSILFDRLYTLEERVVLLVILFGSDWDGCTLEKISTLGTESMEKVKKILKDLERRGTVRKNIVLDEKTKNKVEKYVIVRL